MREPIQRSALSVGMEWASRITTLGMEFVIPALGEWFLDTQFNVGPWGVLIGATLGFILGMSHLLKIAKAGQSQPPV